MPHLGANNRTYVYVSSWFSRSPQLKPERINGNTGRTFVEELFGLVNPQSTTGRKSSINSVCAQLMCDEDMQWKFLISQARRCTAVIYLLWKLYEPPQICTRIFSAVLPLSNALHVHRVFQQ